MLRAISRPPPASLKRPVALPIELTVEQNRWLLQDFVKENFMHKGYVADVTIRAPHKHGDERNVHAHILVTTRSGID